MRHETKRKIHKWDIRLHTPRVRSVSFLPEVTTIVIDVITVVVEDTPKCGRLAA